MKGMGVPGEDVTVVVLTMSPAACDLVATLEDTNVVTATLESRVRGRELIPGIGDLRKRYAQGKIATTVASHHTNEAERWRCMPWL